MLLGAVAFFIGSAGVDALFSNGSGEAKIAEYLTGTSQYEFFASDLQFRAAFPTIPERSTQDIDIEGMSITQTHYLSDLGVRVFGVAAIDWPGDLPFDLNLSVNGAAVGMDGRVENSDLTTFQGYQAVESLISLPEAGGYVRGLTVVAPTRVYFLHVAGLDDSRDEYDRFKDSFSIAAIA